MARLPLTLRAYRTATAAVSPLAPYLLERRASRGKEDRARIGERFGRASVARPCGQLVWIHGASVGECAAALPLVRRLLEREDRSVLMTSGTVTSAKFVAERLPSRALHQYAPIDIPAVATRFLEHWKPDAALFVDSEIWPNLLAAIHDRGAKLALINGRMSKRSFLGWQRVPRTAASILSFYDVCLAQDEESAERFRALGARDVRVAGNLKADVPPPSVDDAKLASLSRLLGSRPLLLAASTHRGEEEIILGAHDALKKRYPDLLTVIAPRHPERGGEIAVLCGARPVVRRSEGLEPDSSTVIYLADTVGEMGLWFRLARFAYMGGSLVPHGGQNPFEAARLSRAVLAGPYTDNFVQAYDAVFAAQGAGRVQDSADIAAFADRFFANPPEAKRLGEAAARAAESLGGALEKTRLAVEAVLSHARA